MSTINPKRLGYLDSLRALVAISVIFYHVCKESPLSNFSLSLFDQATIFLIIDFFDLGKLAVVLFFAISGFVIPFTFKKNIKNPIRAFVISRFFRLYPAYWLSIPLGIYFFYLTPGKHVSATLVLSNLLMLQQFVGIENIIGVYWTLQIELIFYVMCAVLFKFNKLTNVKFIFTLALVLLGASFLLSLLRHSLQIGLPVGLFLALTVMLLGTVWRYYIVDNAKEARSYTLKLLMILTLLIPIISFFAYRIEAGFGTNWQKYVTSYYGAILIFILGTKYLKIENKMLTYLGAISYSLYLMGPIAQSITFTIFPNISNLYFYIVLTVMVAVSMATVTYYLLEKPCMNFARKIITS